MALSSETERLCIHSGVKEKSRNLVWGMESLQCPLGHPRGMPGVQLERPPGLQRLSKNVMTKSKSEFTNSR